MSADASLMPVLLRGLLMYIVLPAWLLAGWGDWLCHRRARIEYSAGWRESLLHQLLLLETGIPIAIALLAQVSTLVLAIGLAGVLAHELTTAWDLRWAGSRRTISPAEQQVHAFQEVLPWGALVALMLLHPSATLSLVGAAPADWTLRWKDPPLPTSYLIGLAVATLLLVVGPFSEELIRTLRRRPPRRA